MAIWFFFCLYFLLLPRPSSLLISRVTLFLFVRHSTKISTHPGSHPRHVFNFHYFSRSLCPRHCKGSLENQRPERLLQDLIYPVFLVLYRKAPLARRISKQMALCKNLKRKKKFALFPAGKVSCSLVVFPGRSFESHVTLYQRVASASLRCSLST